MSTWSETDAQFAARMDREVREEHANAMLAMEYGEASVDQLQLVVMAKIWGLPGDPLPGYNQ